MTHESLEQRCRACEERLRISNDRAEEFGAEFSECACEAVSISVFSPGKISESEILARLVFEPKHVGPDGNIEVGALRDISENGLSLQRRRENDEARLVALGHDMARDRNERAFTQSLQSGKDLKPEEKFLGIVEFLVEKVRAHETADRRSFCVMDSARKNDSLHADIIINGRRTKPERSKLRNELRQLILNIRPGMPSLSHDE